MTVAVVDWTPRKAGSYTLAVPYVDRDLNYSPVTLVPLTVVPPFYLSGGFLDPAVANSGWD